MRSKFMVLGNLTLTLVEPSMNSIAREFGEGLADGLSRNWFFVMVVAFTAGVAFGCTFAVAVAALIR